MVSISPPPGERSGLRKRKRKRNDACLRALLEHRDERRVALERTEPGGALDVSALRPVIVEECSEQRECHVFLSDEEPHVGLVRGKPVEVDRPSTRTLEGAQERLRAVAIPCTPETGRRHRAFSSVNVASQAPRSSSLPL